MSNDECWSGMGIKCIAYCPKDPRILATCALRRGVLEFWDTQTQRRIHTIEASQDENSRLRQIKWSPHSQNEMLVINFKDQIKFLDIFASKDQIMKHTFKAPSFVETAEWHPRQTNKVLIATATNGLEENSDPYMVLYEFGKKLNECQNYTFPCELNEFAGVKVVEMAWNFGEDVFLAVLSNGSMFLFS